MSDSTPKEWTGITFTEWQNRLMDPATYPDDGLDRLAQAVEGDSHE